MVNLASGFLLKQAIALSTVQGVLTGSWMASASAVRCQRVIAKCVVSMHTFVAYWIAKLGYGVSCSDLFVRRADMSPPLHNFRHWKEAGVLGAHWNCRSGPRKLLSLTESHRANAKRARHCTTITRVLKELDELQAEGWTVAFIDGSAKRMGGWNQVSFGCYYGERHPSNFSDFVPADEPQTNNRVGQFCMFWFERG